MLLCSMHKEIGAFSYLRQTSWAGGKFCNLHRLNGVDDYNIWLARCNRIANTLCVIVCKQVQAFCCDVQAFCS